MYRMVDLHLQFQLAHPSTGVSPWPFLSATANGTDAASTIATADSQPAL